MNLSVGSDGREHRWLMLSEAASVPRLWPDPVLGGLGVSIPLPSGALPALISVTTSRQSPLISPRVPAITAGLTWRATLRLLLLQGSACGLGIF